MRKWLVGGAVSAVMLWTASLPASTAPAVFPLASLAQDTAAGRAVFTGKGNCQVCHGPDAKGTPLAPDLTDAEWLNIDGKLESIVKVVKEGVAAPKKHPAPMPPMGGAQLSDTEVQNVAAYVFSLSNKGAHSGH
jgi:cbb3-type cytochrome c oxidase subunit III